MENEIPSQDEPQNGGSYVRNPDGTLTRREWTKDETEEQVEEGTEEQPQQ